MNFSKNFLFFAMIIYMGIFQNVYARQTDNNFVNELNDPRVTVIILQNDDGEIIHNETLRIILNKKLLKMGFKPVMDANHAIKLNDAQLLENVYNGYPEELIQNLDTVTDYLVIGRYNQSENNLDFYDYYSGETVESPLKSVRVSLKVDVIVYDTGEIIDSFETEGIGFANNNTLANKKATDIAGNQAAEKLEESFKNLSQQTMFQFLFKIYADDEEMLEKIIDDLRSVDTVSFVKIREQRNQMGILTVEAYQAPNYIVSRLKEITNLKVYVNKMSSNSCELRVTDGEEREVSRDEKVFDDADALELDGDS